MTHHSDHRIVIDLDGTLTQPSSGVPYADLEPNLPVVAALQSYRRLGYDVVIHTSRGMRSQAGNVGKINVDTLPGILTWLERNDVPFDEVVVGKPWCGLHGFYVDDRALRPSEFMRMTVAEATAALASASGIPVRSHPSWDARW